METVTQKNHLSNSCRFLASHKLVTSPCFLCVEELPNFILFLKKRQRQDDHWKSRSTASGHHVGWSTETSESSYPTDHCPLRWQIHRKKNTPKKNFPTGKSTWCTSPGLINEIRNVKGRTWTSDHRLVSALVRCNNNIIKFEYKLVYLLQPV